jgi:hypothetical protein
MYINDVVEGGLTVFRHRAWKQNGEFFFFFFSPCRLTTAENEERRATCSETICYWRFSVDSPGPHCAEGAAAQVALCDLVFLDFCQEWPFGPTGMLMLGSLPVEIENLTRLECCSGPLEDGCRRESSMSMSTSANS